MLLRKGKRLTFVRRIHAPRPDRVSHQCNIYQRAEKGSTLQIYSSNEQLLGNLNYGLFTTHVGRVLYLQKVLVIK